MSVRLMAVGDMLVDTADGSGDPFALVRETFAGADIVFGNVETSLTDCAQPGVEQSVLLKTPPANVSFLRDAGFSVVNLAHNHARDFGEEGAIDTLRRVRDAGIQTVGTGETAIECLEEAVVDVRGTTVAFAGFFRDAESHSSDRLCIAGMNPQLVSYRIASLARTYDRVVVSLHWGRENVFYPSPEQQVFARQCIDDGAAVVVGHHPHYVQGVEYYRAGLILYSLGNFNFWQVSSRPRPFHRATCIADIVFDESGVRHDLIPVTIDEDYRPRPDPERRAWLDAHLRDISAPLLPAVDKWWWYGEIAGSYLLDNGRSFVIKIRRCGVRHLFHMLRWLSGRFAIKCYIGVIRRYLWPTR